MGCYVEGTEKNSDVCRAGEGYEQSEQAAGRRRVLHGSSRGAVIVVGISNIGWRELYVKVAASRGGRRRFYTGQWRR